MLGSLTLYPGKFIRVNSEQVDRSDSAKADPIRDLNRIRLPIPSYMKPDANFALLVRLEAKSGKEAETEQFLKAGLSIAQEETGTTTWFALKLGPSTFGIFDTFVDEAGREAHLSGRLAAALMQKAPELLAQPPTIEKVAVLAAKLS
jgi:quinol monooxygenase YgiN